MAEFKLGRIKFVYQGNWTNSHDYVVDDVVTVSGKTYICIVTHTSSSVFSTDQLPPAKWNLAADGTTWTGDWLPTHNYNEGDLALWGGTVYICNEAHASATYVTPTYNGLEADQGKWDAFAANFKWIGPWTIGTRYKVRDLITYGGVTYVCNEKHISAATEADGLEDDLEKWDTFNEGITFLSDWETEIRYKMNDVVKYGADLWICTTFHTSTDFISDEDNWSIFVNGFQFENSWNSATTYQIGDLVTYGGNTYTAIQNHVNEVPSTATTFWKPFTTGFEFSGDWNDSTDYRIGNVVRIGGYTYVATSDNTNQVPPDLLYWQKLNPGVKWNGTSQSYSDVASTVVTAAGTPDGTAKFDIVATGTRYTVAVHTGHGGSGYDLGDVLTIPGTSLGGISPSNDITLTVTSVFSTAVTGVDVLGYSVTWASGTAYVLGDAVYFGANSYICVDAHIAGSGNRPDADLTGAYWNILASGAESAVLTTQGDTFFYGANGPERLPIGSDGQVLRVRDGYPSWSYYGLINNLVYVANTGADSAGIGQGLTMDKPWKTVRYACEQIENGYLYPNATTLLKKNKQFVLKEVYNYLTYTFKASVTGIDGVGFATTDTSGLRVGMQITFTSQTGSLTLGGSAFTSSTVYYVKAIVANTSFTVALTPGGTTVNSGGTGTTVVQYYTSLPTEIERDAGYVYDAIIHDLSHGGTLDTTTAILAYYDSTGLSYINTSVERQVTEFVAAQTYMASLISNVLSNIPPANSYQTLNAITPVAEQIIDTALETETGVTTRVTTLTSIVIDGLAAGNTTGVPTSVGPYTTISVKTGTYNEVLPIVIPRFTAVVGDELRSSVIQPKAPIDLLINDKPKTKSALSRIKALVPSVISNTPIAETSGNTATQNYIYTENNSIASISVKSNVSTMKDILANGLGVVPSTVITDPANFDVDYFNARRLIVANKTFLVSEVDAWIDAQIAGNISPFVGFVYAGAKKTKCQRDVGYIVDALQYDLTYGGNLATQIAARSYYSYGVFVETGEKDQALAVQTRIKSIIDNIANGNTAGWTKTTSATQVTTGTLPVGSAPATFAQARIQEMYDTINTGTTPTTIEPSTSWVSSAKVEAKSLIELDKTAIRASVIAWINKNYPTLDYNEDTCSRDVGYIVDALSYDMMFGSNFLSIWNASSYYRGLTSTEVVLADQLTQSVNMMNYIQALVLDSSAGTSTLQTVSSSMVDILANGLTAIPTFELPTPTSGTGNASDFGYYNAARLVYANKAFLQAEVSAWIDAQILAGTSPFSGFVYAGANRTKCERDVGYIVDALRFDLTYGGNLATVIAARSYYSNGVLVEVGEEDQAKAVELRIKDIIDNIVTGNTAGWTKTTANVLTQVTSGTAGSAGAATFAQARIQEIHNTIDTGVTPITITPDISWVHTTLSTANTNISSAKTLIQAKTIDWINEAYPSFYYNETTCSRDVGYMIDALRYDMMFGSNFLSCWNAMSYYRALTSTGVVTSSQLQPTLGTIGFVTLSLKEIAEGETTRSGSIAAVNSVSANAELIQDIINNGTTEVPAFVLPSPTGYNTTFLNGYGDAKAQIVANYAFIKDEIASYLNTSWNAVWSVLTTAQKASCTRDVGYILDSLQHDMTYGGNVQSLITGSSYYSFSLLTIGSTELAATEAAYARLKDVVGYVITENTSWSKNTSLTQDTSGTPGSAGSSTFAQARVQDVIDWITNGYAPATLLPTAAIALASTELQLAYNTLQAKKTEIQDDTVVWVKKFYQDMNFNSTTCRRDVGLIVDALSYDLVFGSNFNSIKAGMSYLRVPAAVVLSSQLEAEINSIKFIKYKAKAIAGGGAVAQISNAIDDISSFIDGGAQPRFVWPDFTGIDAENGVAAKLIWQNKEFLKAEIIQYITNNYPSVVYSQATCSRDVGYIVDAVRYDMTYGGNYATRQAGLAYYSQLTSALQIGTSEKTATLAAYGQLKTILQDIANGGLSSYTPLQTSVGYVTGTAGDAASATMVGNLIDGITTTINALGSAPAESLASTSWVASGLTAANSALQSAKSTIKTEVTAFITENYPSLDYDSTTCERDVGYIVDAIGYDLMFAGNFRSVKAGMSYYEAQASLVLSAQKEATIAAFNYLKLKIEARLTNATALASASANMQTIIDILDKGVGETPEVHGTNTYTNALDTIKAVELLRVNKDFLAYESTAWITASYGGTVTTTTAATNLFTTSAAHNLAIGDPVVFSGSTYASSGITIGTTYYVLTVPATTTFTVSATQGGTAVDITANGSGTSLIVRYSYDETSCRRDMTAYIDAIIHDLQFTGNYKSLRAANLYVNAVDGSYLSDMFQVSNASGLRNCTMNGLRGTLTNPNTYGTKRPTAGAFVALNPGFGPNDYRAWVANRSHYSQNCTMFGVGCSGAKIDAALHNGGNKSMVKNDFTTIISDGIGVWCTGSGSLTELVSVFNYYGYSGYLAELGGRIRATNGNSSYGTYGVIAEGVDTFESSINGTLDNRAAPAQIGTVVTDAVNSVLRFEYTNAGINYTNHAPSISGSGYNATAIGDEFRDAAVFETRVIDLNDGNGEGGSSYVTSTSVAQESAIGGIVLAATDILLSTAYVGMRVQITAGTGVGQYANILNYNNGTKLAKVIKDSFTTATVTGSTTTVLQASAADVATLYVNMPIYLSATTAGILTAETLYYVESIPSTTTFKVKVGTGGSAITGLTATSGQTISLYAAGWDHVVPGTTISNSLDLTTAYIIEPKIQYTTPGYTATARTLSGSGNTWQSVAYGNGNFVAVASGATVTSYSTDGKTWATGGANSSSQTWGSVVYGGGEGAVATAVVGGLSGSGAVLEAVIGTGTTATQIIAINVINGGVNYTTAPVITITGGSGAGATAHCRVLNGAIAAVVIDIQGSGYLTVPTVNIITSEITKLTVNYWGRGYTSVPQVTIGAPFSATTWSSAGAGTSGTYYSYLGNFYRATSNGTFTTTGPTHTSGSVTNGSVALLYVGKQATATAVLENEGVSSYTITEAGYGYSAIPSVTVTDTAAKFVAISHASTSSSYQTVAGLAAGSTWTASSGGTGKTDLQSLTYGAGIYVAVGGASGTASAVSSSDGSTWIDRSSAITSLGGGSYSAVTYGTGTFVAINTGGTTTSWSTNGVTWTSGGTLPNLGSNNWKSVAYGNGRFVAVQGGGSASTYVAYSIDKGVTWVQAPAGIGSSQTWQRIKYGQGLFFAVASGGTVAATSPDGINWTVRTMPGSSTNWNGVIFGNPNRNPLWVAISSTSGTIAASIRTGAKTLGRMKVASGTVLETRIIEPGSGYPKGTVTAVTGGATDTVTVSDTTNLVDKQPVEFTGLDAYGLTTNTTYYVIGSTIVSNTSFKVSATSSSSTPVDLTTGTALTGTYTAGPIVTVTDPNKVDVVGLRVRTGDGVLGNPSFDNRGTNNATATANTDGDGYSDLYQNSSYINVAGLYSIPNAGANVEFASIPGVWYKLVTVTNVLADGNGNYTAQFQINPAVSTLLAPSHSDAITTKLSYSQVRLTGHDFLYIGTGNQSDTNYPYVDPTTAIQANQTNSSGGGRVFFTSTDQDGNFNVGNLFGVQQATGTATLNASAFNLAGLQSLQLGAVTLGINSAIITQFSTDPYFTANSDNVVPTQKAIKAYITAQIGGGSSSLNVNTITAGQIKIANNTISNTLGYEIKVTSKMNFQGGIDGAPVALVYFGQR